MTVINIYEAQARVAKLGFQLCVAFPAGLFALTLILRKSLYGADNSLLSPATGELFGYVVIAIALADVIVASFLKKRMITAETIGARLGANPKLFAKQLAASYVPILAICAAPAVYGLIFFFIVGDVETYVLISVICPTGYMLAKPRRAEVEEMAEQLFKREDDSDIHL
jgi:hypothetical protein